MFLPLNTDNSLGTNFNQVNDMMRSLEGEQQVKVFKGPNNLNALTVGKLVGLGYGFNFKDTTGKSRIIGYIDSNNNPIFKVSKNGFDASTATNNNLVFNSAQNVFKIVDTTTMNLNTDPGFTAFPTPFTANSSNNFTMATLTYTHNLGFVPQLIMSRSGQGGGEYTAAAPGIQDMFMTGAGTGASGLVMAYTKLQAVVNSTAIVLTLFASWSNSGSVNYSWPPFELGRSYKVYLLQETAN